MVGNRYWWPALNTTKNELPTDGIQQEKPKGRKIKEKIVFLDDAKI